MKRSLFITKVLLIIILLSVMTVQFSISFPNNILLGYDLVSIQKKENQANNDFLESLVNVATQNDVEIVSKTSSSKNNQQLITYYSNLTNIKTTYPPIFSRSKVDDFKKLEIYNLDERQYFLKAAVPENIDTFIKQLEQEGYIITKYPPIQKSFQSQIQLVLIFLIILVTDVLVLYLYISTARKKDAIRILNGKTYNQVLLLNIVDILLLNLKIFLILLIVLTIYLVSIQGFTFMIYGYYLTAFLILLLLNIMVTYIYANKSNLDIIGVLKNQVLSTKSYQVAFKLKLLVTIVLGISAISISQNITYISQKQDAVAEYEKFSDVYITQGYSDQIITEEGQESIDDDNIEQINTNWYNSSVEKFNGVISNYYHDDGLIVNVNYFDFFDIYKEDGTLLVESDFNEEILTYLVPVSQKDDYEVFFDYEADYDIIFIKDDQEFMSLDLEELQEPIKISNEVVQVFPNKLPPDILTNITAAISAGNYFLTIPGDDPYNTILPLLNQTKASNFYNSVEHITIEYEEQLFTLTIELILMLVLTAILCFSYGYFSIFTTINYFKINNKYIAIKFLNGQSTISIFKPLYVTNFIILFGFLILIFNYDLKPIISSFLLAITILDFSFIYLKIVNFKKKKLVASIKGERWF